MPATLPSSAIQAMDGVFHDEITGLRQLAELLQQEFEALSATNGEAVATLTQEKLTLLMQLEAVAQRKSQLLESLGYTLGSAGLTEFLDAAASPELSSRWSEIENELRACRKQNLVNGQLLETTRRQTQQLLSILVGESDSPAELYTAKGGTTLSPLSTHTHTKA